jgi:type IV pilus assembly protein PilA
VVEDNSGSGQKGTSTLAIVLVVIIVSVAAIGMLSALAVFGVRKYLVNAKAAEARTALVALANGVARCGAADGLPATSQGVPSSVPSAAKYQSAPADWNDAAFRCSGFALSTPQYFQYQWQRQSAERGRALALSDLDGDGTAELGFEIEVTCSAGACRTGAFTELGAAPGSAGTGSAASAGSSSSPTIGALLLVGIGGLVTLSGGVWFLVVAFQHSWQWGLLCMCVPFGRLIFLVKNWQDSKRPFLLQMAGLGILGVAGIWQIVFETRTPAPTAVASALSAPVESAPPSTGTDRVIAPKLDGSSTPLTDVLSEAQSRALKWDPDAVLVGIDVSAVVSGKVATEAGSVASVRYQHGPNRKSGGLVLRYDKSGFHQAEGPAELLPSLLEPSCPPERVVQIADAGSSTPATLSLAYAKDKQLARIVWSVKVVSEKKPAKLFDGQTCAVLSSASK